MKHWVFDLDGTLVDSFAHYFDSLSRIFRDHGSVFSDDLRFPALTEPLDVFFERHLGRGALQQAFTQLDSHSHEDARSIRPFEGFQEMMHSLRVRGARVSVWTNRDLSSATQILRHSGLSEFMETCVSGTCVTRRKPDPEGLLRIIDHYGCRPDEVTMVGDHEHDVMAAKAIGAKAVRASWHSYWKMGECPHADHQFHSAMEFSAWVQNRI